MTKLNFVSKQSNILIQFVALANFFGFNFIDDVTADENKIKELELKLNSISRKELANEDVSTWNMLDYKCIPVHEFLTPKYNCLRSQAINNVRDRYPEGDVKNFIEFLNRNDAKLYLLSVGKHLLSMMGSIEKEDKTRYLCYFVSPKKPIVQGLSVPFANTIYREVHKYKRFSIAKPFITSFLLCMQKDYVAYGLTNKEEHKHRYFKLQSLPPALKNEYIGKKLNNIQISKISEVDHEQIQNTSGNLFTYHICGKTIKAGVVEFHCVDEHTNIQPGGSQGRFYEIIEEQVQDGHVLTGFYRLDSQGENQKRYLAIFEEKISDEK